MDSRWSRKQASAQYKTRGKSLRRHWDAAAPACFNDEPFSPPFFLRTFYSSLLLRLSLLLLQLLFFTSLVLRDGGNHPLPSSGTLTPLWLIIPANNLRNIFLPPPPSRRETSWWEGARIGWFFSDDRRDILETVAGSGPFGLLCC